MAGAAANRAWCLGAAVLSIAAMVAGCSALPSSQDRRAHADALAARQGWQASVIVTGPFDILSYGRRVDLAGGELSVYIEGDGFAWVTGTQPSDDPTPQDPVALQMALAQPDGVAAYLARPCQYTMQPAGTGRSCTQRFWTDARFAADVVQAEGEALDALKRRYRAGSLVLVGYSGGGAIAALLASTRSDVRALITVAGNLDHEAWTRHHHVRALGGSLNAADQAARLVGVKQTHFVGAKDAVVPPGLARAFAARLGDKAPVAVLEVPGFGHACCWAAQWPQLWNSLGKGRQEDGRPDAQQFPAGPSAP